jgi:hypothetical protein
MPASDSGGRQTAKVEEDIAPGRRSYGICTRTQALIAGSQE